MRAARKLMVAGLWVGLAVGLSGGNCGTDEPESCVADEDCDQTSYNLRCPGQMRCVEASCEPVCDSCVRNEDCYGMAWSGECDPAHWSCQASHCVELCSQSCEGVADCFAVPWASDCVGHFECSPIYGCKPVCEEGCSAGTACRGPAVPDCGSRYVCSAGFCEPECGAPCQTAEDCADYAWPGDLIEANCTGNWECQADRCTPVCGGPCAEAADCEGRIRWAACPGGWECQASSCQPACAEPCTGVANCTGLGWGIACGGHFACVDGGCDRVCDPVGCGDQACDAALGETETSCPADCAVCVGASDCAPDPFELPCQGRFECQENACVPLCDYEACGDGECHPELGEGANSCARDCLTACRSAADCVTRPWTALCAGAWTCYQGQCGAFCNAFSCGNGRCEPSSGESGPSCPGDCLRGGCSELVDCLPLGWAEACAGHWACRTDAYQNACEGVCDAAGCPDGTCDVLGGETDLSCPADCASYACLTSPDCASRPPPAGCVDPTWLCVGKHCFPTCK